MSDQIIPNPRQDEAAENIIRIEGLIFALASSGAGRERDLHDARACLKAAICRALRREYSLGLERGREETNASTRVTDGSVPAGEDARA